IVQRVFNAKDGLANARIQDISFEMEGTDSSGYTDVQYEQLTLLTLALMAQYPMITLANIVGHCDIAPGRKTDPGDSFDWVRYKQAIIAATVAAT
uniref:N-acetylmuramoyl-L-alanine amidase n=1 Tax=Shewanella sp. TaxID=50422 RepID=UPI0040489146